MKVARIGSLEVSLWLFQDEDEGGEVGYAVKLRHRGALVEHGASIRDRDMKSIADALSWALSEFFSRSSRRRWLRPKF